MSMASWMNYNAQGVKMTTKTYVKTDKKGRQEEWSWEETQETFRALAHLRAVEARNRAEG